MVNSGLRSLLLCCLLCSMAHATGQKGESPISLPLLSGQLTLTLPEGYESVAPDKAEENTPPSATQHFVNKKLKADLVIEDDSRTEWPECKKNDAGCLNDTVIWFLTGQKKSDLHYRFNVDSMLKSDVFSIRRLDGHSTENGEKRGVTVFLLVADHARLAILVSYPMDKNLAENPTVNTLLDALQAAVATAQKASSKDVRWKEEAMTSSGETAATDTRQADFSTTDPDDPNRLSLLGGKITLKVPEGYRRSDLQRQADSLTASYIDDRQRNVLMILQSPLPAKPVCRSPNGKKEACLKAVTDRFLSSQEAYSKKFHKNTEALVRLGPLNVRKVEARLYPEVSAITLTFMEDGNSLILFLTSPVAKNTEDNPAYLNLINAISIAE